MAVLLSCAVAVPPAFGSPAVTTANVNLRKGPGTNFDVVTTIPDGTAVDLGDCDASASWCAVTAGDVTGFMSGRYIQETEDPDAWPRSFATAAGGTLVVYQPQITAWDDFRTLDALVAAEYLRSADAAPVYGVIGLKGSTAADAASDSVVISDITVTTLDFSALGRDDLSALNLAVGAALPTGPITISEDRITASLAQSERLSDVTGLKADPPPIFHSTTPAILVQTDGEPTFAPIGKADGLSFVVNTNWDIVRTDADGTLFLRDGQSWLTAQGLGGPWTAAETLPASLSSLPEDENWSEARAAIPPKPFEGTPPTVFVSDVPAELILFDGPPAREAVPGTALDWISNTTSDVFFHRDESAWYVLLSGRWFRAASLDGPWTFATPDLPADFRNLPADTPYYSVRYSVPGTSESNEARLKASIPHTARVDLGAVAPAVDYDGDATFEPIDGTALSYATNTNADVIEVEGRYYVLQDGVWFVGDSPTGPFAVATGVPAAIYDIPPSSPVYRVTYVRIYDTEPDAVWFGYTMGYLTGYLAWGTYVYGSGWRYPPYWYYGAGRWPGYFPRPVTFGIGAYYNPVRGLYGRYGYAYGPGRGIAAGSAFNPRTGTYVRGAAVAGPLGERGFVAAYNPRTDTGAIARGGHDVYGSWGAAGVRRGSDWARVTGGSRGGAEHLRWSTSAGNDGFVRSGRRGNVYAGRDGNVYRNTGDGWQRHDTGGGWSDVDRPDVGRAAASGDGDALGRDARPAGERQAGPLRPSAPEASRAAAERPAERQAAPARAADRPAQRQQSQPQQRVANRAPAHLSQDVRARHEGNQQVTRRRQAAQSPRGVSGGRQAAARGGQQRGGGGRGGHRR